MPDRAGQRQNRPSPSLAGEGRRDRRGASPPGAAQGPSPPRPERDELVLIGEFGRPQGLKGEVRLKSFTVDPLAIAAYGTLVTGDGRSLALAGVRPATGGTPDLLVARVEGVTTRTDAQALNRVHLYLRRDVLGATDEDEYFAADLIGLIAEDSAGQRLGKIVSVPNYGGGDLLEIAPTGGGRTALLPFVKAFVPVVDPAAGRVVVDAPDLFADEPVARASDGAPRERKRSRSKALPDARPSRPKGT